MTDSTHAWLLIIFLVFLDLIVFYSLPYLSFMTTVMIELMFVIIGIFNALAIVYVMS
jgi:hypothetical protein